MRKLRYVGVISALLIALMADSSAQPRRHASAKHHHRHTQTQQQQAAPDQRGTAQSPLVVQPLPTPKSAEETTREQQEAAEKHDADLWTWLLSLLTFLAIAGQLVVLAFQAFYLRGTLLVTKTAADAAKRSATAFLLAERGYLFIRINSETVTKAVSTGGRWNKSVEMFAEEMDTPGLGFSFRNFGKTAVLFKEFSNQLVLLDGDDFPTIADYKIRENMPDELVLEPGQPSAILGCLLEQTFTVGDAVAFQQRTKTFWFYGYVKFDDAFGKEHEWRWRFRYRRGDGRFRLVYYREFPEEPDA